MIDRSLAIAPYPKAVLNFIQTDFYDLLNNQANNIEYFWSTKPFYLKQYTELINKTFDEELNLKDVYNEISGEDLRSFIYMGKVNETVISGVRVTINDYNIENSLPSEKFNFNYHTIFPELNYGTCKYCEVTRFAVAEKHRNNPQHYKNFFKELKLLSDKEKIKYIFFYAERKRSKLYSIFASRYFDKAGKYICDFSDWEGFENLKWKNEFHLFAFENKSI